MPYHNYVIIHQVNWGSFLPPLSWRWRGALLGIWHFVIFVEGVKVLCSFTACGEVVVGFVNDGDFISLVIGV